MSDYETGREIARREWFLKPDASEEMQRGYQSAIDEAQQEFKKYRPDAKHARAATSAQRW